MFPIGLLIFQFEFQLYNDTKTLIFAMNSQVPSIDLKNNKIDSNKRLYFKYLNQILLLQIEVQLYKI